MAERAPGVPTREQQLQQLETNRRRIEQDRRLQERAAEERARERRRQEQEQAQKDRKQVAAGRAIVERFTPKEPEPVEEAPPPPQDPSVADRVRASGYEAARQGLQMLSESDRRVSYRAANPTYGAVRGYTDAMQGTAPVGRRGIFDPARMARAREGLAMLQQGQAAQADPRSSFHPDRVATARKGLEMLQRAKAPPTTVSPFDPERSAVARAGLAKLMGRPLPEGAVGLPPGELPAATLPDEAAPLEGDQQQAPAPSELPPEPSAREQPDDGAGILQRQMDAEEMAAASRVDTAQAEADAMADASARYQQAVDEAEAKQAEQDARVRDELEASKAATQLVQRTAKAAIEAAAIDPKRAWSSAGTGRKLGFVLSAITLGISGNSNPTAWVDRYIAEDIEQQRQQATKAAEDLGTAQAAAAQQDNLFARTLAQVGDERVAADIVRVARVEQLQADLKARLAQAGVRQLSAEQEAMLTHLEEDKAQAQMRIQMTAAQNPQYFVRSTYAHGKGAREGLRKLGEGLIDQATTSEQRAADQEGKVELKRLDLLAKEQERAAARDDKVAEQAYRFGKDVERLEATNGMIQELLDQDDIAGYGYTEGYDSPGKMDTDGQLRLIIDELGRIKSGGAITEDEFASFSEMIKSGVELGDGSVWEGSETRLRKNLEQVQKFLKRKVASQERGLTQEARQFYNRNVANQDFDPRWSGPQRPVQIQED